MASYLNSTIVDVDATVIGPMPLADVDLPEEPASETALLDPGVSHTILRVVGISTLTGASLTLMTKPVFWLDAKYLYSPPVNKQPVSERFSSIDAAAVRFEPETIVVPSVPAPRFSDAANTAIGGTEEVAIAPETTPLSRPQGFRPPTTVKPGAINLPPVPATLPSSAPVAADSVEITTTAASTPPQLDLSVVLPVPPTVTYQPETSEQKVVSSPQRDFGDAEQITTTTISLDSENSLPAETFATVPPSAQTNSTDIPQGIDQTLPWEESTPDISAISESPSNIRSDIVTLNQSPSDNELSVLPSQPLAGAPDSPSTLSESTAPVISPPEPSIGITPTNPVPPALPNSSVPSTRENALTSAAPEPPPLPTLPPETAPVEHSTSAAAPPLPSLPRETVTPDVETIPAERRSEIFNTSTPEASNSEPINREVIPSEQPALPWPNPTEPDTEQTPAAPIILEPSSLPETATDTSATAESDNEQILSAPTILEPSPLPETAASSADAEEASPTALSPESTSRETTPEVSNQTNQVLVPAPSTQAESAPSELEIAATSPEQIEVSQFTITGNTVFDSDLLESVAWEALNAINQADSTENDADTTNSSDTSASRPSRPVMLSRADLVRASDAITQYYVEQQYISSGAYVPEADWSDGAVEIRVIEGSLDDINVTIEGPGLFSLGESYVRDRLRLATRGVLNLEELVDGALLLEQDPLIDSINTEIVPSTETGTSNLNVNVIQDDGLDVNLSTSNRRSPSIGSFGQQVIFSQANLLGRGDRLSLGYERTEGLDSWDIGYSLPLNARNGVLSFDFNTTDSRIVEDPFDSLDIESNSQTYELSFRQPLTLTPTEEFALTLTGYHRDNKGRFLESLPFPSRGADADGRTQITAVRFGQEWIKRQPKEVFSLFSEFSLGVNALGATISDTQPDSEFFLWRGQGQWVRRLGDDSLFLLRGNVQLADSALVPSEQFGIGGQTTVRGYRPNSILSDNGWLISSEVRLPIMRVPEVDGVLQVAPFLDIGGGWNNGGFADPDPDVLTSTGLGLLWRMGDNFDARLDWGIPLTNDSSLEDSGLQFSINFSPF